MKALARVAAALSIVAASACTEPDTEIVGSCVPLTDAVLLVGGRPARAPSVGMVDGHILLTWYELVTVDDHDEAVFYAQWFDRELGSTSDVLTLGHATAAWRSRWVAADGALVGQTWIDPDPAVPTRLADEIVGIMELRPPPALSIIHTPAPVDLSHVHLCPDCITVSVGSTVLWAGAEGMHPGALAGGEPVFGLEGIPAFCDTGLANATHLHVFDRSSDSVLRWPASSCEVDVGRDSPNNLAIVGLEDGRIGALFRLGDGTGFGYLHYLRLDDDRNAVGAPIRVGAEVPIGYEGGFQPRAMAVEGSRILFTERGMEYVVLNGCHALRIMQDDGSGSRLAPWQLGCRRQRGELFTQTLELVALPDGRAAIAWGERTGYGDDSYRKTLTSDVPWSEQINLAMLTADGRRGSEIARVTDERATALAAVPRTATGGPFPGDFFVTATSEGERVLVTWMDARSTAPGVYGRLFSCGP